jgi:hypothetical protein
MTEDQARELIGVVRSLLWVLSMIGGTLFGYVLIFIAETAKK